MRDIEDLDTVADPQDQSKWSKEDWDFYRLMHPVGDGSGTGGDGCAKCGKDKKIFSRGLCAACYHYERRAGTLGNWLPAAMRKQDTLTTEIKGLINFRLDDFREAVLENGYVLVTDKEYSELNYIRKIQQEKKWGSVE